MIFSVMTLYHTQIRSIICNIALFYVHNANLGCFLQDTGPLSPVVSCPLVTSFQSPQVLSREVSRARAVLLTMTQLPASRLGAQTATYCVSAARTATG